MSLVLKEIISSFSFYKIFLFSDRIPSDLFILTVLRELGLFSSSGSRQNAARLNTVAAAAENLRVRAHRHGRLDHDLYDFIGYYSSFSTFYQGIPWNFSWDGATYPLDFSSSELGGELEGERARYTYK